jgi:hypothetical protein
MRYLITLTILSLLTSCSLEPTHHPSSNQEVRVDTVIIVRDSLVFPPPDTTLLMDIPAVNQCVFPEYFPNKKGQKYEGTLGTWKAKTYVYDSSSTNSKIIDTLDINTPLRITGWGERFSKVEYSKHVKFGRAKRMIGYVDPVDMYTQKIRENALGLDYLFSIEKQGGYHETTVKINGLKRRTNEQVCTVSISDGSDSHWASPVMSTTLKNVESMVHIGFGRRGSCPGVVDDRFYYFDGVDPEMKKITSCGSTGEAGYYDALMAYFPVKFNSGKVLLVHNADLQNIFNTESGALNVFEYPDSINVPIEELVVMKHEVAEPHFDRNNQPMYYKNGQNKMKITERSVTYFRWNGKRLIELN